MGETLPSVEDIAVNNMIECYGKPDDQVVVFHFMAVSGRGKKLTLVNLKVNDKRGGTRAALRFTGSLRRIFFLVENGKCHVDEFLSSECNEDDLGKITALLETFSNREIKNDQKVKIAPYRGEKIIEFKSFQVRLYGFHFKNYCVVVTNGCKKKKDKADPAEYDRAIRLKNLISEFELK